ncbi:MAG: GNAT family N-acetyltransferase, partial [Spirochaetaceae bacterium]|nr:GNAT family N-acetyltransferase [Spirochaetaceae bacterium]
HYWVSQSEVEKLLKKGTVMKGYNFEINDEENSESITFIERELDKYNNEFAQPYFHEKLNVLMKDEEKIIGGLIGGTYWGWLYIDRFWVNKDFRKLGFGSKLLKMAENEAINRGCTNAHLDTHDFQAVEFYKKNGYEIVSKLENLPKGFNKYLMKKTLQ